jgi:hypothetical protein
MTIDQVLQMLYVHTQNKENEKALATARADAPAALVADAELIETRDTIARIEAART